MDAVDKLRLFTPTMPTAEESRFFAGSVIGAFDGRLGNIDYRGAKWFGYLMLAGSPHQIECIFDKSKGEDEFNRFGNKRVSITGRAIYTGESELPERLEVMTIDGNLAATEHIDIRGSLQGQHYFSGWDNDKPA